MAVLGVDGWRGKWVGALLDGRTAELLVLPAGTAECVGDGTTDARGRPMRICW